MKYLSESTQNRRGSSRHETPTAALVVPWYDSRIMPFLAGIADGINLEFIDLKRQPSRILYTFLTSRRSWQHCVQLDLIRTMDRDLGLN